MNCLELSQGKKRFGVSQLLLTVLYMRDNFRPTFYFLFKFCLFILFLAVLGLRYLAWAFSACSKWELFFIVCWLLMTVPSLVEHGF